MSILSYTYSVYAYLTLDGIKETTYGVIEIVQYAGRVGQTFYNSLDQKTNKVANNIENIDVVQQMNNFTSSKELELESEIKKLEQEIGSAYNSLGPEPNSTLGKVLYYLKYFKIVLTLIPEYIRLFALKMQLTIITLLDIVIKPIGYAINAITDLGATIIRHLTEFCLGLGLIFIILGFTGQWWGWIIGVPLFATGAGKYVCNLIVEVCDAMLSIIDRLPPITILAGWILVFAGVGFIIMMLLRGIRL